MFSRESIKSKLPEQSSSNKRAVATIISGLAVAYAFGSLYNSEAKDIEVSAVSKCRVEYQNSWETASYRSSFLDAKKILDGLGLSGQSLGSLEVGEAKCQTKLGYDQVYQDVEISGRIGRCIIIGLVNSEYNFGQESDRIEAICQSEPKGYLS